MSRYNKLAAGAFRNIANGAGILVDSFNPATGDFGNILGVTSGGINFTATPSFKDYGEDMDNCNKNTMQLKRVEDVEVKASGSFTTVTAALARFLAGAADIDSRNGIRVVPLKDLSTRHFQELWIIVDYSSDISEATGGFCAVQMMNVLSTGGFQMQTTDREKGKFAFEFTAHYDYNAPDTVPYNVYVKEGDALIEMSVNSAKGNSAGKTAITVSGYLPSTGEKYVYQTAASVTLPARGGDVSSWTEWNGIAQITATTGNEIAIVVCDADNAAIAGGKTIVVAAD